MGDVAGRILAVLEVQLNKRGWSLAAIKTYDQYRARLWGAMVRLYNGGRDASFVSSFVRSIDVQLTEAWNEGADQVGVAPDEMTPEDMLILEEIQRNEHEFIERVAGEIVDDKDGGMAREDFDSKYGARVDLWANRYNETVNRARMQFGSKQRMEWILGSTEEHCSTCSSLDGIVAFGYEFEEARFHPQMPPNPLLECEGWRCDCQLTPTDKRRTPRALDKLTAIATAAHL